MKLKVFPGSPLLGAVTLPGDKSISHRAALFAALAHGESRFDNFLSAGVTEAMLNCLAALDIPFRHEGDRLAVHGNGLNGLRQGWKSKGQPRRLDCGNSGTTMRLLAGALAAMGVPAVLDGSQGLRRRPMLRIVDPLQEMGANITSTAGCAPLHLGAPSFPLKALDYSLPVASAQVKSCLLLAALSAGGLTRLREPGPSRDHSERMLRAMGVEVSSILPEVEGGWYETLLNPDTERDLQPLQMTIPGDFSSAAFLIVAALITPGSQIHLKGVGLNPTRTGLLDVLMEMGADIEITPGSGAGLEAVGELRVRASQLRGVEVGGQQVVRMIDEFPVFAAAAAFAEGETIVRQAEELRHKETDRIHVLCDQLSRLGVAITETGDGFIIRAGRPISGGTGNACGDHRLAMAMAVLGLASQQPVQVLGAEMIAESFPAFTDKLIHLGAEMQMVQE